MKFSANLSARGRFAEALEVLGHVAAVDPLNIDLAVARASLLSLFHGYESGIDELQRLIELDLESPPLWSAMAELAATFGRYEARIGYAQRLNRAAPGDAWAMAQLGDAYTELGELTAADEWISAAEQISSTETLKARGRWLAANGDWIGFNTYVRLASEELGPLQTSSPLTPAQSAVSGLFALERGHAGYHTVAASLFQRIKDSSPTLPRRSPHVPIYVTALLARELKALNDQDGVSASLAEAQVMLDNLYRVGIREHPWLTLLQAVVFALDGDDDRAEARFVAAIEQGFRAWGLEQYGVAAPLRHLQRPVRMIEGELARIRANIGARGMISVPEEYQ